MQNLFKIFKSRSDDQSTVPELMPQYLRVTVYLSRELNKIIIRPLYRFAGWCEQESATVLDFAYLEGELGHAVINALDEFKVISNEYWTTNIRDKKSRIPIIYWRRLRR